MRLLAVLRESLQQSLPANMIADAPDVTSFTSPHESKPRLDVFTDSLPGVKPLPRSRKRTKAAALIPLQSAAEQQLDRAPELQLNGASRSVRLVERAAAHQVPLNGVPRTAESPFHGPMKPLRPAGDEQQHASAARLNGAHSCSGVEPDQASGAPVARSKSPDSQAQALQGQAPGAMGAEAAVGQGQAQDAVGAEAAAGQEAAEEAACTEALSIALSGKPPAL